MDLTWLITFLIFVVVMSIAWAIVKYLIMPVVPAAAQTAVWAIIGVILLIALLYFAAGHWTGHSLTVH